MSDEAHGHDPDEPEDDSLEEFARFERDRQSSLRCFQVWIADGTTELIWAHRYENTNPAGHLNFITVLSIGVVAVRDSFARGLWLRLREVTDDTHVVEKRNIH